MASLLTIAGVPVPLDVSRTAIQRLTLSVDEADTLEFGQFGVSLPLQWHTGQDVTLTVDGTLVFTGEIASTHLGGIGDGPIDVGYRAYGLKWVAGSIPVTNPQDGTGTIVFNLPSTDPNYIAQLSGQSVGQILTYLFTHHATALATCGVTGFNASDLTPLTIVPPTQNGVLIQGSAFIDQCEYFLHNWYAQYVLFIPADGIIRVMDSTAFTPTTFTLDSDPITLDDISRDTSQCYTRVVIRGYAEIEPAYLSLSMGTLQEAFTAAQKLAWTWSSFVSPSGAIDQGTITTLTSTQITVQSSNAAETWAVNYWAGIESQVQLINPAATDISFTENRQVTANTALAAGGTSVLTLDSPLVNSGYTVYYIWGQPPTVSDTWRLYNIVPQYVAQHLVKQFSHSVPWGASSSEVVQTNFPAANICYSSNGQQPYIEFPATFEVMPATGQIRFSEPVVRTFGTLANLEKGGNATDGIPDDIKVLVPYSRGTLTATCPADLYGVPQYQGTAFTEDGIEWTLYRDFPQWMWSNDAASYQQLACQILTTVCNTVVSGALTYWGKYSAALTLGLAANVASVDGTTGFESINAAIRTVSFDYPQTGPTPWVTRLNFSTVRRPFSGDTLYAHPMFAGGHAFGAQSFSGIDLSTGGMAQSVASGLSYLGEGRGGEVAARMFGNSDELRKSLGLGPSEPAEAPEPAEGIGEAGGFEGGEGEPAPGRRRRKRPTLKPTPKKPDRGAFVGPPESLRPMRQGAALTAEESRRQRAAGDHDAIRGRYDQDEDKHHPFVGPPKPAIVLPTAGEPAAKTDEEWRRQRATGDHDAIRDRHSDD